MLNSFADQWALITGASSGIGAEFARQLAARGMHLVLTARRRELLEGLAQELHTAHGTKTEIILADLADPQAPAQLLAEIAQRGRTLELVINNAGFGVIGVIEETDPARVQQMVQVNIAALTDITYRVLPGMLHRGHGAIINVASVAAFQPVGYMSAYAASKAYVLHFTEALWAEAREKGVTLLALCPGTTRTDFFDISGAAGWLASHRAQEVQPVVKCALRALEKRRPYVVSGWANYLLSLAVRLTTRAIVVKESLKYFRPKK